MFGSTAYIHIEKSFPGKISRTPQNNLFLRSSDNSKTYLRGVKDEKGTFEVKRSRNVTFNEQKLFNNNSLNAGQTRLEPEADLNPKAFLNELIIDNVIPKATEEAVKSKICSKQWKKSIIH